MANETKDKQKQLELDFKNIMFSHAFAFQNAELYKKIYPEDFGGSFEEEEIEWVVPQSEEEALALFNDAFGEMLAKPDDKLRSMPLLEEQG